MIIRSLILLSLLSISAPSSADQAYIQASPWVVNRLPVLAGQPPHQRCVMQTSFTGLASVQFITDDRKLRGAIFILSEPVFEEQGRTLDVTISAGGKGFEFPAQTMSKYAVAVEISPEYQEKFRAKLGNAELMRLKSGFNTYNFSIQLPDNQLAEALSCSLPNPEPPLAAAPEMSPISKPAEAPVVIAPDATPTVTPPLPLPVSPPVAQAASPEKIVISPAPKAEAPRAYIVQTAGKEEVLATALPKLIPASYTYNLTQGASLGDRVSWEKGSDWLETLIVALDDIGLQAAISGKNVTILPKLKSAGPEVVAPSNPEVSPQEPPKSVVTMPVGDPSKPPSVGMKEEASSLLMKMRLDEQSLSALLDEPAEQVDTKPASDKVEPAPSEDNPASKEDAKIDAVDVTPPVAPTPDLTIFKARKGESLQKVLTRWSAQAGTPTDFELQRDYFLDRDMVVQGDYDVAVERILTQFKNIPDSPRIAGTEAEQRAEQEATPMATPLPPSAEPEPEPTELQTRLGIVAKWSAAANTSLRSVLTNWARQSQLNLMWVAPDDLLVPQSIASTSRLEDALEGLLAQYDNAPDKPSIHVNRDPDTGLMVMIVDVKKSTSVEKQ